MKKQYGEVFHVPGQLPKDTELGTITAAFDWLLRRIADAVEKDKGKLDFSHIELFYHTPDDEIGNPLDMVKGDERPQTTIAVKLYADLDGE